MIEMRLQTLLDRNRLADMFVAIAEEDHVFYTTDRHLGCVGMALPLAGMTYTTVDAIKSVLTNEFLPGSMMGFMFFSHPHVDDVTRIYRRARSTTEGNPNINTSVKSSYRAHAQYFEDHTRKSLLGEGYAPMNETAAIWYLKVPLQTKTGAPNPEEIEAFKQLKNKCLEALASVGLYYDLLDEKAYLTLMRQLFDPFSPIDTHYNSEIETRKQILGPTDSVQYRRKGCIVVNDKTTIKIASVKRMPQDMSLHVMNELIGDPSGLQNQFTTPFFIATTIHFPDQSLKKSELMKKQTAVNYQAFGPFAKWAPKILEKKSGIDVMINAMNRGDIPIEMNMTVGIYGENESHASKMLGSVLSMYSKRNITMGEEKLLHFPMFWNSLPLQPCAESIRNMKRYWTMGTEHTVQFLPILGDWRGTGTKGANLWMTRRSQPLLFDPYDSPTNYNMVISGDTGGGKSFTGQSIVLNELSLGSKVWVIDSGYSYKKVARIYGGEFIDFDVSGGLCLNPFTTIEDFKDEKEQLKSLIAIMSSPNEKLTDKEISYIGESLESCYSKKQRNMTMHDIYEYLCSQADAGYSDVGRRLFEFSASGSYDKLFNGISNLNFKSDFVVIELEGLANKPHLQQIVMLMFAQRIQYEAFRDKANFGRRRMLVIEEAYRLLKDTNGSSVMGKFVEELNRRIRKAEGSVMVVTQMIGDLLNDASGRAILSTAAWKILMPQSNQAITEAKNASALDLDDYGYNLLRSLRSLPPKFSEALIVSKNSYGVARITADPFKACAFSTKGKAFSHVMAEMDRGVEPINAVLEYLESEGVDTSYVTV